MDENETEIEWADEKTRDWKYIGDGVYARYNGYSIILIAGTPDAPTDTIYLEPDVMRALREYEREVS